MNENDKDTVNYVKDKINSAMFLISSIERRKSAIFKKDKKHPLSDQKLCKILNSKGINVVRRTVAKHRKQMET